MQHMTAHQQDDRPECFKDWKLHLYFLLRGSGGESIVSCLISIFTSCLTVHTNISLVCFANSANTKYQILYLQQLSILFQ